MYTSSCLRRQISATRRSPRLGSRRFNVMLIGFFAIVALLLARAERGAAISHASRAGGI
jgi:hypothetical protein